MISRRSMARHNRGRVPSSVQVTPLSVVGAADLLQWWDLSINGGASGANDLSGKGNGWTAGANAPTYDATGLNGLPIVTFDGTNDVWTNNTLNLPDPSVTPAFFWLLMMQPSWTISTFIWGANSATLGHRFLKTPTTPNLSQNSGATVNANGGLAANGTWGIVQVLYSGSTSDYVQVNNGAPVTGASAGTNASTGRQLGATNSTAFGAFSAAAGFITRRNLTTTEKDALRTVYAAKWGAF